MPGAADTDRPLAGADLVSRLEDLAGSEAIALGVSGGSDSTALMHVAAAWTAGKGASAPPVTVLTVDHGLRPEAAEEAAAVKREAGRLGLRHVTLVWDGDKPRSGLAARARAARYGLMAGWCRANDAKRLFVAHTRDDQAETLVMRLARGSGLDGLSGMDPEKMLDGIVLVRPFLDVSRQQLRTFLNGLGASWFDDPSNVDDAYERVRIRKALVELEAIGVSSEKLAVSARRLRRARQALGAMTAAAMRRHVEAHATGYCSVSTGLLSDEPEEIALRVLASCLTAVGGLDYPPRHSALEALLAELRRRDTATRTLGGCRIGFADGRLDILREPGRMPAEPVPISAGETVVWDGRFRVRYGCGGRCRAGDGQITVRPLCSEGWDKVKTDGPALPKALREGLVSFWRGDDPVAVPHLSYRSADLGADMTFSADFCNFALLEGARIVDAELKGP